MTGALNDIKVLDLTHVLAGPFCTYQLALLGADVIKIEDPANPDCARGRGPDDALNAAGLGLNYQVQGANKRSLALNLRSSEGVELFKSLAKDVDIIVENFATGALAALGVGYEVLRDINPELIHCSITGYGDSGPQADHGAYDNVIQATSGTIAQCGGVKPAVSFVDYATGYAAAFAVTAALTQRSQTGAGTHISVSMLEVAMQMMAPEAAAAQHVTPTKRGKEAGIASYETQDGHLMLGAFRPVQYRKPTLGSRACAPPTCQPSGSKLWPRPSPCPNWRYAATSNPARGMRPLNSPALPFRWTAPAQKSAKPPPPWESIPVQSFVKWA